VILLVLIWIVLLLSGVLAYSKGVRDGSSAWRTSGLVLILVPPIPLLLAMGVATPGD